MVRRIYPEFCRHFNRRPRANASAAAIALSHSGGLNRLVYRAYNKHAYLFSVAL